MFTPVISIRASYLRPSGLRNIHTSGTADHPWCRISSAIHVCRPSNVPPNPLILVQHRNPVGHGSKRNAGQGPGALQIAWGAQWIRGVSRVIGIACAGLRFERLRAASFWPSGVRGGTGKRVGTRFPAQDSFISWTGAGPPGAGSVFNLFPLYRLPLEAGFDESCAVAIDDKANTAARAITDRATADLDF